MIDPIHFVGRLTARLIEKRREMRARRMIEDLSPELQRDIGWPRDIKNRGL